MKFSSADVEFYHKNGYLLPQKQLFSLSEFDELNNIFLELLVNKGQKRADELDVPHFKEKRLFKFLMHENILDIVEQFIGPDIGLWSSHFICKEPLIGRQTPWHEDSSYWEGRFDRMNQIITIWLAMNDVSLENGCMGVIPGTHYNGFSEYQDVDSATNTFWAEIKPEKIDIENAIWFELNKGEFSLHDGRIIHGAGPNKSDRIRCGYTMRYFNLNMNLVKDHPLNTEHKIWYCRGEVKNENPLLYI